MSVDEGLRSLKFQYLEKKYKPTVIRLNVEDDDNVNLLDDPHFWPDGVICRPWVSNFQHRTRGDNRWRRGPDRSVGPSHERPVTDTQYGAWSDYNPYDNLHSEVD